MTKPLQILIVEDEPLVAEDISGHLISLGYNVAGIHHTAEEAIEDLKERKPDAVLVDITLGGELTGHDVAEYINEHLRIPFVFLTSHSDRGTIERVKKSRPGGYLLKPFDENDLLTCIELAMSNYHILHPELQEVNLNIINTKLDVPLSDREFEVLVAMRDGKTNSQLADSLFLSVNTIKTHLQHIYEKLEVSNRTEALFKIDKMIKNPVS